MIAADDHERVHRAKTDKSLSEERSKTDEHLERRHKIIEQETTAATNANRRMADEDRALERARVDRRISADKPSAAEERTKERHRLDEAIKSERKSQDGALRRERFQKRLVAEALLASERLQTDENLFDERDCADRAAARMSELLCDEQTAHTATRATLAYRDQALAMVSHDLKNPAIAITIAARLIRKRLSENDRNRAAVLKDLTIIEQSALSIDRMIDALLDIERIAHGKFLLHPHEGDLCLLLQESMDLFSPIASNKPCTLTANICPGPLWATFDHDRLLQVLSNLIGNAIKFTPPGGLITLSARQDDGRTVISVSDSGPGVSQEDQTRLFQKFSQLQQEEGGLGLGLYIAKSIVEAHGGHIGIDSVLGQGCTFTFDLPSGSAAPLGRQNAR